MAEQNHEPQFTDNGSRMPTSGRGESRMTTGLHLNNEHRYVKYKRMYTIGKLHNKEQEMARLNIDVLGKSDSK